jgi:hypothetical protein
MGVLRALVNGQWVDVSGGNDEVFIGPDDPALSNPGVELWYDTDDTASGLPWNVAWGLVGSASITASSPLVTTGTPTDVPGLAVPFTAVLGRRYKVWAQMMCAPSSTLSAVATICDAAGVQLTQANFTAPTAGFAVTVPLATIVTPGVGAITYKVRLAAATSANVGVIASPTFPAWIAVEDIGGS